MLRAVETHVLEEVREAALRLIFEDGADFLGDIEIRLALRLFVVPDVIGQAVVEFANLHVGIHRDRRHLLGRRHGAQTEGQGDDCDYDSFHTNE